MEELRFATRFRGPVGSANGGYAAGRLAAFVDSPEVEVTLRLPPPLEQPLLVERIGDGVQLLAGDALVAEARAGHVDVDPPPPVTWNEAAAAEARHLRMGDERFAECFVCGVRAEHDGLSIHVGAVAGRDGGLHAARWTPAESAPELVWAAIDCPGAYAVRGDGRGEAVLGRMTARVDRVPAAGERCVVVSWPLGEDGRKLYAGTALFTEDGEVLALARQTWIAPRSVAGARAESASADSARANP